MNNNPTPFSRRLLGTAITLLALALAGCATSPTGYSDPYAGHPFGTADARINGELAQFLETAGPGATLIAPTSPWGEEVTIIVSNSYFAASGRHCRELVINQADSRNEPGLACRLGQGQWEPVRPLTRGAGLQ